MHVYPYWRYIGDFYRTTNPSVLFCWLPNIVLIVKDSTVSPLKPSVLMKIYRPLSGLQGHPCFNIKGFCLHLEEPTVTDRQQQQETTGAAEEKFQTDFTRFPIYLQEHNHTVPSVRPLDGALKSPAQEKRKSFVRTRFSFSRMTHSLLLWLSPVQLTSEEILGQQQQKEPRNWRDARDIPLLLLLHAWQGVTESTHPITLSI